MGTLGSGGCLDLHAGQCILFTTSVASACHSDITINADVACIQSFPWQADVDANGHNLLHVNCIQFNARGPAYICIDNNGSIEFSDASHTGRVWITQQGSVGIGVAAPSYSLDVAGSINIHDPNGANGYAFRVNGVPIGAVQVNGTLIGARPTLNLIAGAGVTITGVDSAPNNRVNITITAPGGGGGNGGGGGESQTPWLSDIDANGHSLYNVHCIQFNSHGPAYICLDNSGSIEFSDQNHVGRVWITQAGWTGVGAQTPSNRLVVGDDIGPSKNPASGAAIGCLNGDAVLTIGQSNVNRLRLDWTYNANAAQAYAALGANGGLNPLVLQDAGGFVGIGAPFATSPPQYRVDVAGDVNLRDPGGASGAQYRINGVPLGTYQANGSTIGIRPILNLIAGANVTLTGVNDAANNRVNITIAAAGGTVGSPQTPWESDIDANGYSLLHVNCIQFNARGPAYICLDQYGSIEFSDYTHTGHVWITQAGNVGVGTAAPVSTLDVVAVDPTGAGRTAGDGVVRAAGFLSNIGDQILGEGLEMYYDPVDQHRGVIQTLDKGLTPWVWMPLFIESNPLCLNQISPGNVGIGLLNPVYKLDVAGDVNVRGTLYINGVAFASGGSVHLAATSISGIDGRPLQVSEVECDGVVINLKALLEKVKALEARLG